MKLSDQYEKILQRSYATQVASERFHRYALLDGRDEHFELRECERRFKILQALISDLKNFCIICGSDN